ncbi:TPA: EpsG family protein [Vibrio vulnificus]
MVYSWSTLLKESIKNNMAILRMVTILILYIYSPFIALCSMMLWLPFLYGDNWVESRFYIILIVLFVVIVNSTKLPEADLENYYKLYDDLSKVSFFEAFKVKSSDPIFTYVTSFLTLFDEPKVLIIFWNFTTIYFLILASYNINQNLGQKKEILIYTQIIAGVFYFSQPEHITHTTRAFASLSVMLLALSYYVIGGGGKLRSVIFSGISVGIHSSSLVLLFAFCNFKRVFIALFVSFFLGSFDIISLTKSFFLLFNVPFINASIDYLLYRASDSTQYMATSKQIIIVLIEFFLVLLLYVYNNKYIEDVTIDKVCRFFFAICCLIFLFRNIPLFSIRMYIFHNYFFFLCISGFIFAFNHAFNVSYLAKFLLNLIFGCLFFFLYIYKFNLGTQWDFAFFSQDQVFVSLFYLLGM